MLLSVAMSAAPGTTLSPITKAGVPRMSRASASFNIFDYLLREYRRGHVALELVDIEPDRRGDPIDSVVGDVAVGLHHRRVEGIVLALALRRQCGNCRGHRDRSQDGELLVD